MEETQAILLVDDEAIILLSLRMELMRELGASYRYEVAHNAQEALRLIADLETRGHSIALVISDWRMPGMTGDEFLMRVRETRPAVKTLLVSGQTDEDKLGKLHASGALDVFMRKPWDPRQMIQQCRRLLGLDNG